jgi:hypothetical protein
VGGRGTLPARRGPGAGAVNCARRRRGLLREGEGEGRKREEREERREGKKEKRKRKKGKEKEEKKEKGRKEKKNGKR